MTDLARLDHIYAGYPARPVLVDVSLVVRAGEVLALVGPNGAGKTTLLRTLARQLRPTRGCVLIAGEDPWRHGPGWAAARVAVTPPESVATWPLSVRDTVTLGRAPHRGWLLPFTAADRAAVDRALVRTGLTGFDDRLTSELSAGEGQRVMIARALAQEPRVLLLDEPTAHLDIRYQGEMLGLLRSLARDGLAVVAAVHDLNLAARWADRVAVMKEGRLSAVGPPNEVLTAETLAVVYDTPVRVVPHPVFGTPLVVPMAGVES